MMKRPYIVVIVIYLVLFSACVSPQSGELKGLSDIEQLHAVVANSKTSYIYFGRPTCPDCNDFIPYLEEVMKKNAQDVYYFNTDDRKNDDGYDNIIEIFDVDWVPALYMVQDNVIINKFPLRFGREPSENEVTECVNELNIFFGSNK